jgi:hypothetical protein
MAALCRRLEKQFELKEVLSPEAFLPHYERVKKRSDTRRIKLATDIRQTLGKVKSWEEFVKAMKGRGYELIKGRGITFIDEKKVKIKGSEVGFPLSKIESFFNPKNQIERRKDGHTADSEMQGKKPPSAGLIPYGTNRGRETAHKIEDSDITAELKNILELLLKSEYRDNHVPFELTEAGIKKKKKKKRGYNRGLGY